MSILMLRERTANRCTLPGRRYEVGVSSPHRLFGVTHDKQELVDLRWNRPLKLPVGMSPRSPTNLDPVSEVDSKAFNLLRGTISYLGQTNFTAALVSVLERFYVPKSVEFTRDQVNVFWQVK